MSMETASALVHRSAASLIASASRTPEAAQKSAAIVPLQRRRTFHNAWLAEHGDFGLVPDGTAPLSIPLIEDAP